MQEAKPKVGDYWPGKGGVFIGTARDKEQQWNIFLAIAVGSVFYGQWGKFGRLIEGEFSVIDGQTNTQLILANDPEHPIAKPISQLTIDGHSDFYWPAQKEENLIYINGQEHVEKRAHWSSTQYSARYAWSQGFGVGGQYVDYKSLTLAARAVRRELVI